MSEAQHDLQIVATPASGWCDPETGVCIIDATEEVDDNAGARHLTTGGTRAVGRSADRGPDRGLRAAHAGGLAGGSVTGDLLVVGGRPRGHRCDRVQERPAEVG